MFTSEIILKILALAFRLALSGAMLYLGIAMALITLGAVEYVEVVLLGSVKPWGAILLLGIGATLGRD